MAVEVAATRRLFTREEYHRMGEAGILKPSDRVELIRGEIVDAFVNNLNQLLAVRLAGRAIVAVQGPIALADDTEPEPDVAIIQAPPGALQGARGPRGGRAPADRPIGPSSGSTPRVGFPSTGWSTVLRKASRSTAHPTPVAIATSAASLGPERLPCRRFPTSR